MDFSWIWESLLLIAYGVLLLRLSGRRTISHMTFPQTVIMLSIGTLLISPITRNNIWITLLSATLIIIGLIFLEYLQLKSDIVENIITGKSKLIIENGALKQETLRGLRMTVDKLEMRLRQEGIINISDVKWATIEPNGQLGYMLKEEKQPATKEDINKLMREIEQITLFINKLTNSQPFIALEQPSNETNLFTEIKQNKNIPTPPKHLQ